MERYCLNLVFVMEYFGFPSMVIETFAWFSSLGWHLFSLSFSLTSVQDLLAFLVSGEKSGVILIGLSLYVALPFPYCF